jgi:hypothetical protein
MTKSEIYEEAISAVINDGALLMNLKKQIEVLDFLIRELNCTRRIEAMKRGDSNG